MPLADSRRAATPSRSRARARSRCSVDTSSSRSRSASACARSRACLVRSPRYWPLAPRTFGIPSSVAFTSRRIASGRAPSLARTGPTPRSRRLQRFLRLHRELVHPHAHDSALPCFNGGRAAEIWLALPEIRPRVVAPERLQLLVQLPLFRRQLARHGDLARHELIAGAAALEPRHAIARQPERTSARGRGRHLHRDLAAQG